MAWEKVIVPFDEEIRGIFTWDELEEGKRQLAARVPPGCKAVGFSCMVDLADKKKVSVVLDYERYEQDDGTN